MSLFPKKLSIVLAMVLFFVFLWTGYNIARTKFLWNDEIYTQLSSINNRSYGQIWRGALEEGNNNPLFYALQKFTVGLFDYKAPSEWIGRAKVLDPQAQIILRINAVAAMSLMLSFVFYYFSTRYGLGAGALALGVFLTSGTIWSYWAEARPYGLWIALATAQLLLFKEIYSGRGLPKHGWLLFICNVLMALTILFGVFQIVVTSLLLAIKEKSFKKFFILSTVPVLICAAYYMIAPHYIFHFDKSPAQLIFSLISPVYFILPCVYFFIVWLDGQFGLKQQWRGSFWGPVFCAMLVIALLLVGMLLMINRPGEGSFALSNRYFIFLVPIFLVIMTDVLFEIFEYVKSNRTWALPYGVGMVLLFTYLIVAQSDLVMRLLGLYLL